MLLKMIHETGFYLHSCEAVSVIYERDSNCWPPSTPDRILERRRPEESNTPQDGPPNVPFRKMMLVLWDGETTTNLQTEYPVYLMNNEGKTIDKWIP